MEFAVTKNLQPRLSKVAWITLSWTGISIFQFFSAWGNLIEFGCDLTGRNPLVPFEASVLTGLIAGVVGGSTMVFLWEKWLRTKPYGWTLRNIFLTYVMVFFIVAIPTTTFFLVKEMQVSLFSQSLWTAVASRIVTITTLVPFFFWLVIVVCTMIVFLVNDKYGPGVFKDFLLGKYFHPQREERIFMFMDLRSSTLIAEKLGEELYFNFLRDVFRFATPGVLAHKGEIYQYVGDEMVVSWKTLPGVENANCLQCFFDIQKSLLDQNSYFLKTYGQIPEFKAGLHYGYVMAGEIGVVKRDIAFSGDVLNTTSRIQEKCNELGVNVLISKFLMEKLNILSAGLTPKEIGDIPLKGKEQSVVLFTV